MTTPDNTPSPNGPFGPYLSTMPYNAHVPTNTLRTNIPTPAWRTAGKTDKVTSDNDGQQSK